MFGLAVPPATFAVPSPKLQLKVMGGVPPVACAVKLTEVPTVPVVGATVKVTARAVIVIVVDAVASLALASVTLTLTVKVPAVA